jgi:hypothetical protein
VPAPAVVADAGLVLALSAEGGPEADELAAEGLRRVKHDG